MPEAVADPALTEADQSLRFRVQVLLFLTFVAAGFGVYKTKYETLTEATARVTATALEKSFKLTYLAAYLLAMLADWLQGPYVYALYAAYGFSHEDNSRLFIFGFGSSMLFGTFIGGYADKHGRKKFAILYCVVYAMSCATKHFNSFFMLSVGRILAGVATSLLYSVFESWVVCEHQQRGFTDAVLGDIFSLAIFGNSCVAIGAGFLAQWVSDFMPFTKITEVFYIGQYTNPFDCASLVLFCCALWIHTQWGENFGDAGAPLEDDSRSPARIKVPGGASSSSGSAASISTSASTPTELELQESSAAAGQAPSSAPALGAEDNFGTSTSSSSQNLVSEQSDFEKAWNLLKADRKLQCVALMSGFFESSMFIFVFLWTPAILGAEQGKVKSPPFGLIFAVFMLGCMTGSCAFSYVTTNWNWDISKCALFLFTLSAVAHAIVVFSSSTAMILAAFVLFEVCVGLYFPTMGLLKSKIVPENCRSTLYNFFRVPLNFIVCCVLLSNVPVKLGFTFTTCLLLTCVYLLHLMGDVEDASASSSARELEADKQQIIGGSGMADLDLEEGNPIRE